MPGSPPFFREAGSGPGVVCLHAHASCSAQWRGLMEQLAPNPPVLAPDTCGAAVALMAALAHPEAVDAEIARFLGEAPWRGEPQR